MSAQPPELPITAALASATTLPPALQPLPVEPWNGRELLAVLGLVAALDVTVYRGQGYAGYGMLFLAAPVLLLFGARWPVTHKTGAALIAALLLGLAARSAWCGNILATLGGCFGLVALAYQLNGHPPFILETIAFGFQAVPAGLRRLFQYQQLAGKTRFSGLRIDALAVVLPLAAVVAFSALFVLANPDVLRLFSDRLAEWAQRLTDWLSKFSWGEIAFCATMAVVSLGLLRPSWTPELMGGETVPRPPAPRRPSPWYAPVRNTLVAVNLLFVAYLAFEFRTLWFREFPTGFHYSGYAHQGAAWLTVALALATVVLSVFFRGELLTDTRLARVQKLAGAWAILNVILAVAVYHRLWIYVGFNGMTRMRTVGFLGTSAVVGGLLLVLWKIARGRNFVWLVRRQLWVLAAMVYVYAVLPVDRWVTDYNVRQILAGRLAPCVQIAEHPNSAEGFLRLSPLLKCDDPRIRAGVRALLATLQSRRQLAERNGPTLYNSASQSLLAEIPTAYTADPLAPTSWSAYQIAVLRLRTELDRLQPELSPADRDVQWARDDWASFRTYAYQWY